MEEVIAMKKRLVALCVDSLFTTDLEAINKLPHFHEIVKDSIVAKDITCIYPTLTYPCHATIMSGCYPNRTGIVHNEKLNPATNNASWHWYYEDMKVRSIFDYARENGMKTAGVLWPVTAGAPVDYLIPEIWTENRNDPQDIFEQTISEDVREIYQKNKSLRNWKETPEFDMFGAACAVDIIHAYKPEVMLLHMATLDHYRHMYGTHAPEVQLALKLHDEWLGMIMEALRTENLYEDTAFIILGDHGQMPIKKNICINHLFREKGLLQVNSAGEIVEYDAYAQSCGISAQIYIKDKSRKSEVLEVLRFLQRAGLLMDIFTREEIEQKQHLSGDFDFVVEAVDFYAFSNAYDNLLVETSSIDYKYNVATHGHLPGRGEKPCFIIHNSGQVPQILQGARLIDEAPTMLELLGIKMTDVDGVSLL
jgi:predicted AlkP superfamily pyrophosphatase or phosphodiesterase